MENLINRYLKLTWVRESLFFILVFTIYNLGDYEFIISSWYNFFHETTFFIILYIHAMLHRFWLFPLLFDKKQKIYYFQWSIILLMVFAGFSNFLHNTILLFDIHHVNNGTLENKLLPLEIPNFWEDISTYVLSIFFISSVYFFIRYFEQEKKEAKNHLLINQLEINHLRGQLNPHFMFNTLNNLYGISLEQPERTPDLILKMSQLMRYQIEASRKEYVTLTEELDFVESYITIENERVNHRCELSFEKKIVKNELLIAPILLLPFIENAFKHATTSSERSFISIFISIENNHNLHLNIKNSIPSKTKASHSTGVGLDNVNQRLMKLYPDKYQLEIIKEKSTFSVNLSIHLNA